MAKYWVSDFGTKIDVTGLDPQQLKKVKEMAQGKGAYGSKGATMAAEFQKQNAKQDRIIARQDKAFAEGKYDDAKPGQPNYVDPAPEAPPPAEAPAITPLEEKKPEIIDPVKPRGVVDVIGGTESVENQNKYQFETNLKANNPNQKDVAGNSRTVTFNPDGTVSIVDEAGVTSTTSREAFVKSLGDFQNTPKVQGDPAARQRAQDANYNYITKTYARDKASEMENAKQELANRGIPLNPDPNSLWGKTLRSIDEKYQGLDDQAKNQAITQGNETFSTDVSASRAAFDSALSATSTLAGINKANEPNFQAYQGANLESSTDEYLQLAGMDLQQVMQKYGLSQAAAQAKLDRANELAKVRIAASASGRSGGGGSAAQPPADSFGGAAP